MATSEVKLLGTSASPFVNRVQIALNLKSIDYEFIEESLIPKSKLLVQSNPVYKKVPVLIHGDKLICESRIIVQYIDEIWPNVPSILPLNPSDRATARFWADYIDNQWYPLLGKLRWTQEGDAKAELISKIREGLVLLEGAFVNCSKGKAYFGGDSIGYLDIVLGSFFGWLMVGEKMAQVKLLEESKVPGLANMARKFCSNAAVKGVMVEVDKLIEILNIFVAKSKTSSK